MPVPDLLHEGQGLPFGNWDGAKDNGAWCGQRLADRLNERLTEQLHLPNLINDAHAVPGAAAGTGLQKEGTVTGTAEPCDLDPGGPTLTAHQHPQQGSWAVPYTPWDCLHMHKTQVCLQCFIGKAPWDCTSLRLSFSKNVFSSRRPGGNQASYLHTRETKTVHRQRQSVVGVRGTGQL